MSEYMATQKADHKSWNVGDEDFVARKGREQLVHEFYLELPEDVRTLYLNSRINNMERVIAVVKADAKRKRIDYECIAAYKALDKRTKKHIVVNHDVELNLDLAISTYALEDSAIHYSDERDDALWAQLEINLANKKIRELYEEIAKQEADIKKFNLLITNYKRFEKCEKANARGRPVRSLSRENQAKSVIATWVSSLMTALEVKSCGEKKGLEMMLNSVQERNWRRWLNGISVPSYRTFSNLLDTVVSSGKYAGQPLFKVPVNPTHDQVLTFLKFI